MSLVIGFAVGWLLYVLIREVVVWFTGKRQRDSESTLTSPKWWQ